MLKFLLISVSTILGFLASLVPVDDDLAFYYGDVGKQPEVIVDTYPPVTKILFTGDIMLARNVELLMKNYGSPYPFAEIQSTTKAADFTIGNFEAAVPKKHIATLSGSFRFSVHQSFLERMKEAGFDYLSLANNHSYDYGLAGLENTHQVFKDYDLKVFGEPGPLTEQSATYLPLKDGRRLALIGLVVVGNQYTKLQLETFFSEVNKQSDIQIVYIHWGEEYKPYHSKKQELLAQLLVTLGADVIVGHHPHVVQDIQLYQGVPIFYSLGNFVFDQYFSEEVQKGLLLKLDLNKFGTGYELIPVTSIGSRSHPRLMAPHERERFLIDLSTRSTPKLKDQIRSGYLQFDL